MLVGIESDHQSAHAEEIRPLNSIRHGLEGKRVKSHPRVESEGGRETAWIKISWRQIEIGAASNERWSLKSSLIDPIMRLLRSLPLNAICISASRIGSMADRICVAGKDANEIRIRIE